VEEGSGVESSASENKDIVPNVDYNLHTDDEFRNKRDEKEDYIAGHILTDKKSKQVLIQKKQNEYWSNDSSSDRIKDSLSIIDDVLRNNDSKILSLLGQETGSNYSFKGLIRKLNIHQQSLARALNRLEDLMLIEKSQIGYKLSTDGESLMMLLSSTKNSTNNLVRGDNSVLNKGKEKRNGYIQLLQTYISVDVKHEEILQSLIGKWFNNLRWVGLIESEGGGYMLQWVTYDNNAFQIILRVIADYLIIETNASSDKEKIEAMIGSYKIFEQITKLLRKKLEGPRIINMLDVNNGYISKQNN
jgi:DNA-binding HxlR family transcriptional regulator